MKQTILFLRNGSLYADRESAIAALGSVSHVAGQPVVAIYGTSGSEKLIFAIGTAENKYHIVTKDAEVEQLSSLISSVSEALGAHEDKLAGSDAGHAKTGGDLTFNSGIATVNNEAITYAKLQKIVAEKSVLGSKTANGEVSELNANDLYEILSNADSFENLVNKSIFETIVANEGSVSADNLSTAGVVNLVGKDVIKTTASEDKIELTLDTSALNVFSASQLENSRTISLSGDAAGSVSFNGTEDVTLEVTIAELDDKAPLNSPAFTGTPTAPTAAANTNDTQVATTAFVQQEIASKLAAADALRFKGTVSESTALPSNPEVGDTYKASSAFQLNGENVEIGDMIICTATTPEWAIIQTNIDGAVTGPSNALDNSLAVFDGVTGKVLKSSQITVDSIVVNSRKVSAGSGLTGGGELNSDITISHVAKPESGSVINEGDGFITDVTVDEFGHVASVSRTKLGVTGGDAETGKYISAINLDENGEGFSVVKENLPAESGKVKAGAEDTSAYINEKLVSGTTNTSENIYGVNITSEDDDTVGKILKFSVKIDTIDGGTY